VGGGSRLTADTPTAQHSPNADYDRLANVVRKHVDMDRVGEIAGLA